MHLSKYIIKDSRRREQDVADRYHYDTTNLNMLRTLKWMEILVSKWLNMHSFSGCTTLFVIDFFNNINKKKQNNNSH